MNGSAKESNLMNGSGNEINDSVKKISSVNGKDANENILAEGDKKKIRQEILNQYE